MEKRILRAAGVQSMIFLGICILIALIIQSGMESTVQANNSAEGIKETIDTVLSDCSNYIKIEKSQEVLGVLEWNANAIQKTVTIQYSAQEAFTLSVAKEETDTGLESDYFSYLQEQNQFIGTIKLSLHDICEVKVMQDAKNIYVVLYEPANLFDTIIVIDPGHGGIDSGTPAIDNVHVEKDINLNVAQKVKASLETSDSVKVYLTRENDSYLSPQQRVELINEINPELCISIHCNSAENSEATGVEVLYGEKVSEEDNPSKLLAETCLAEIISQTNQVNRGLVNGNSIYIIRNSNVPIALVEIGFLSNAEELNYLLEDENQIKVTDGIVNAIRQLKG